MGEINAGDRDRLYKKLKDDAERSGYYINPDIDFTLDLISGLLENEKRYGYQACPCRLASGNKEEDIDMICPCDYRDPDLDDYGMCYCSLYVSKEIFEGKKEPASIPDRRDIGKVFKGTEKKYPVWRCKVCGYLCARDNPPQVCPICKAGRERFESFRI